MEPLIRPEVRAALWRWREAIGAAAIALLGLYWALAWLGPLRWLGVALTAIGAALCLQGIRRARFPQSGEGPGLVEVDERQITYFAAEGGAAVSIDALVRVEFDARAPQAWLLHADGAAPLRIPADARGVGALFDALAPLPGADFDLAIRAARGPVRRVFVIWTRARRALH